MKKRKVTTLKIERTIKFRLLNWISWQFKIMTCDSMDNVDYGRIENRKQYGGPGTRVPGSGTERVPGSKDTRKKVQALIQDTNK